MDGIGQYRVSVGEGWCQAEVAQRCIILKELGDGLLCSRWVMRGWEIHSAVVTLDGRLITGMNGGKIAVWNFEDPRGVVATFSVAAMGRVNSLRLTVGGAVVARTDVGQGGVVSIDKYPGGLGREAEEAYSLRGTKGY